MKRGSLKLRIRLIQAVILGADMLFLFVVAPLQLDMVVDWRSASLIAIVLVPVSFYMSSVMPASVKAVFVFWRLRDVLPGHRAFSYHAMRDPRIDARELCRRIGTFPADPRAQNARWYQLFKQVEHEPTVGPVHVQFLLLRDLAAMSLLLAPACAGLGAAGWLPHHLAEVATKLFALHFLVVALGARWQGVSLVRSVLALHGATGHYLVQAQQ